METLGCPEKSTTLTIPKARKICYQCCITICMIIFLTNLSLTSPLTFCEQVSSLLSRVFLPKLRDDFFYGTKYQF